MAALWDRERCGPQRGNIGTPQLNQQVEKLTLLAVDSIYAADLITAKHIILQIKIDHWAQQATSF